MLFLNVAIRALWMHRVKFLNAVATLTQWSYRGGRHWQQVSHLILVIYLVVALQ